MLTKSKLSLVITLIVTSYLVLTLGIKLEHVGIRLISHNKYCNVQLKNMTNQAGERTFGGIIKMAIDPSPRNLQLKVQGYFDRQKKLVPVPIKFNQNICDAFEKNTMNIRTVLDSSNLTDCPIKKGTYKIENWIPDDKAMPNLPNGRYQADLIFLVDNVEWATIRWFGGIVKS